MSIDITCEFSGVTAVDFYQCRTCGLEFFKPDASAGSPSLYEKLEKLDTYYLRHKWEHDAALQDMNGASNGIEIGCGFGAFVTRVIEEKKIPFEGCEQNPSAVRIGQSAGAPIRVEALEHLAEQRPSAYDVVCAFQVLEHVTDPNGFIRDSIGLLRPGGKLILALPNAGSFNRHLPNLYQMPPHHMSRWTSEVLTRLTTFFPLKLIRVAYEPLQGYQVGWYIEAYERIVRRLGLGFMIHPRIRTEMARLIGWPRVRKHLKGEAIYACYARSL